MTRKQKIGFAALAVFTVVAAVWLGFGNLRTEFGPLVLVFVAIACAYGPARAVALWRKRRDGPVEPRMVPLRTCLIFTGAVTFGPALAAAAGWVGILPASVCFLAGMTLMCWTTSLFSDGYQGLWLDALIFHGSLTPPEEDWVKYKR